MRASGVSPSQPVSAHVPATRFVLRPAVVEDVDALVALEDATFVSDRITRRSFKNLLVSSSALIIVADQGAPPPGGGV